MDFTDLWPLLLKLLLTQDPVQILFRYSYLASLFRILMTFGCSASRQSGSVLQWVLLSIENPLPGGALKDPSAFTTSSEILGFAALPVPEELSQEQICWF